MVAVCRGDKSGGDEREESGVSKSHAMLSPRSTDSEIIERGLGVKRAEELVELCLLRRLASILR